MNSRERIRAMVDKKSFDRIGVAGWIHMPLVDTNVNDFVRATISFTDYCQWDFIKVMANAHYISHIFGGEIDFSRNPQSWAGTYRKYPIRSAKDASNLTVQERDNPVIIREAEIAKGLTSHYKGTVPVVATAFSPLMSFQEMLRCNQHAPTLEFLHEHPKELHHALDVITQTSINLLDAQIDAGVDGSFFATQFANDLLTDAEFEEFCRPYDYRILEHIAKRTWFNILHVHGDWGLKFNRVADYPVQALNWENTPKNVPPAKTASVRDVRNLTDKVLIAGLDQQYDFYNSNYDRKAIKAVYAERLEKAVSESGDHRFIFAPGCTLPQNVDRFVFSLMKDVVQEYSDRHPFNCRNE